MGTGSKTGVFCAAIVAVACLTGCGRTYTATERVVARSNLSRPVPYSASVRCDDPSLVGKLEVVCSAGSGDCSRIELGAGREVVLDLAVRQRGVPFSLVRGHRVDLELLLKSIDGSGPTLTLPVHVAVKPWLETNSWLFAVVLGMTTVLVLVNTVAWLVLPRARGSLDFLVPISAGGPYFIYPPSRVIHLRRNRQRIGSGRRDDLRIDPEQVPGIEASHIVLRFRRGDDRGETVAEVAISGASLYRKGPVRFIADPNVRARADMTPTIPDYQIEVTARFPEVLEGRGYTVGRAFELKEGEEATAILGRGIVVQLKI
jgi:hypothetical protein